MGMAAYDAELIEWAKTGKMFARVHSSHFRWPIQRRMKYDFPDQVLALRVRMGSDDSYDYNSADQADGVSALTFAFDPVEDDKVQRIVPDQLRHFEAQTMLGQVGSRLVRVLFKSQNVAPIACLYAQFRQYIIDTNARIPFTPACPNMNGRPNTRFTIATARLAYSNLHGRRRWCGA